MPYTLSPASPQTLPPEMGGGNGESNRWTLNFGPQHPATHTTLRLVLELDGERIVRAIPHIGYLHSGFEKLGEHLNYNQYVTIVDRMDYSAPIYNELAWHLAAEKLMGIDLTPRCKVLRTIAGELGRIQSHLLCVGAAGLDLGAFTAFLYGFNERERIYDIFEYMSGQRFHTSWTRVGGLNMDLPDEAVFKRMVKDFIDNAMPPAMADVEKLLNKNRIFVDRTQGVGTMTRAEALAWSFTGPLARASGVKRDIRKDQPYLCFEDNWDGQGAPAVDFKVPIMTTGDVYARYLVRLEEMKQSLHIIRQLIDNIPPGPVNVSPEGKEVLPPKDQVYSSIEGLIHHFELIMTNRGFEAPKGEVYGCIESGNGELGYYIVSAGENVPWRARTRPPCYINYQSFPKMIEGHMISDVVAVLGSINVIAAELDRYSIGSAMSHQVFEVGERLNETTALQLAADLSFSDLVEDVVVDFSQTQHFEPFGMLLVSSAINRLRRRAGPVHRAVSVQTGQADAEGIAAYMGFWQSVGVPIGREVNAPARKDSYLPITKIGVDELYRAAGGSDPLASGAIEQESRRLAAILTQPHSIPLLDALTYCLRELIRNVIEHAHTPALWLAGMSWPRRNYVQVAVLDEGQGIRASLATNQTYRFPTDLQAVRAALQPGVSRNIGREPGREQLARWEEEKHSQPFAIMQNAGYGLYMISALGREAGQFLIASGNASVAYIGSAEVEGAGGHHGTAIRLVIQPSEASQAVDAIFSGDFARGPAERKPMLSPSKLKRLGLDSLVAGNEDQEPSGG